ncbi:ABC transporter permease [Streptomyces sp. NPDC058953]|uniref:ABC transporter permease n=1 Tax=unclassified Streptomyces TaxID=2593676 RepID=UPI0036B5D4D7
MTAPLTPPHRPDPESGRGPEDNPWRAPEPGEPPAPTAWPGFEPPDPAERAAARRADLRDCAAVLVAVTVLGIGLGLLWLWLAPRVPLISDGKAVFLKNSEGEAAIGADGTFALLGLAFGAVSAVAVFLYRRHGGVLLVVALALGGLLGSVLAWRIGLWFGPLDDVAAAARKAGPGVTFDGPLELRSYGALLTWPLAAMVVHLALTALFSPRDPSPADPPGQHPWGPSSR